MGLLTPEYMGCEHLKTCAEKARQCPWPYEKRDSTGTLTPPTAHSPNENPSHGMPTGVGRVPCGPPKTSPRFAPTRKLQVCPHFLLLIPVRLVFVQLLLGVNCTTLLKLVRGLPPLLGLANMIRRMPWTSAGCSD